MKSLTAVDTALLSLVRAGLWEKSLYNPLALELSEAEWTELFEVARRQTVLGLVYAGINRIDRDELEPPYSLAVPLVAEIDAYEATFAKMTSVIKALYAEFAQRDIRPVLVKGHSVAGLYSRPQLRTCGDIDLYFCGEDFDNAAPRGAKKASDGSWSYAKAGIVVEHHDHLLDISSAAKKKIIDKLIDQYGFVDTRLFRTTSPMLTLLLLDAHILKHCLGRGVGLRQFCDFAISFDRLDFDRKEFENACRDLGIWKWTELLLSFCSDYLGLDTGYDRVKGADKLLARVLKNGNFGHYSGMRQGVAGTVASFVSNIGFALSYAPFEALSTFAALFKGRIKL